MSEHLSQTQLAGYCGRTLDTDELLAVDRHLAWCDVCHERLTGILPDGAQRVARASLPPVERAFHLDYVQHLEPYVDGTADDIDREIVDSHVAECSRCAVDLKDLLAFKQQPVAALTGDAGDTWWRWRQWVPQWPSVSNPALAVGAVVAVFTVVMAVLWWTSGSRPVQHVGTGSPQPGASVAAPSASLTPPTQNNSPTQSRDNEANPLTRGEPLIALNDAGGQVVLNQRGELEGLNDLPPD